MSLNHLKDSEFNQFKTWLYDASGINLSPAKKMLVEGRLTKRLRHHNLHSFGDYFKLIMSDKASAELQIAIDLLTTNETYFFREPKHFEFLRDTILPGLTPGKTFRVWSAACSSGEEVYTIAMVLADKLVSTQWEILGSDLSTHVLSMARNGHYSMNRARHIPTDFLRRFCMKGIGRQEGTMLIDRQLQQKVRFSQINLIAPLPGDLGEFDVIFLRNVMIYFDLETKRKVVSRLLPKLKPGGYFFVSHSESLNGISEAFKLISPSVYQKL